MDIPISCSQQQITGHCAEAEECSPQHQLKKSVLGNWICEVGRQGIAENLCTLWSAYWACAIVRFVINVC